MRKHFLILMLFALLPFTTWAASGIAIGDYTYMRSADIVNLGDALPEVTVQKAGSPVATLPAGVFDANRNEVESIQTGGLYYQKLTFIDNAKLIGLYVPFYVANPVQTVRVNDEDSFEDEMETGRAYDLYYKEYKWADVWYQYGDTEAEGVILQPGETPVWPIPDAAPYKEGVGYYPNTPEQITNANAWYAGLIGNANYGSKIKRSWNATGATFSNPDNYVFSFSEEPATAAWKVAVVYNNVQKYCWGTNSYDGSTTFGSQDGQKHYGLFSVKNQDPHQADIYKEFSVEPTAFDATKFNMFLHPANLILPTAIIAPEAVTGLKYDNTDQTLITAGSCDAGKTMYYMVSATKPAWSTASGNFSTTLPTARYFGVYNVWYVAYDGVHAPAAEDIQSIQATIGKRDINVTVVGGDMQYTGTAGAANNFYSVADGDILAADAETVGEPVTVAGAGATATAVGSWAFTLAANNYDNYKVQFTGNTFAGTLNITKAPLTVTAGDVNIQYGETPVYTYTYTGLVPADQSTTAADQPKPGVVTVNAPTVKNGTIDFTGDKGTYTITPNVEAANYELSYSNGTLTVGKKPLFVAEDSEDNCIIIAPADRDYTGAAQTIDAEVMDGATEIDADEELEITYLYSATNTSTSTFTAIDEVKKTGFYKQVVTAVTDGNYTGSLTSDVFEVKKVDLLVLADDVTTIYKTTAPTSANGRLTISYEGFVGSDTKDNVFTGGYSAPVITNTNKNVNIENGYTITPTGGSAENYNLVRVSGTLKIQPAKLIIKAKEVTRTYGNSDNNNTVYQGRSYLEDFNNNIENWITIDVQTNDYADDAEETYATKTSTADMMALLAKTSFKVGTTTYYYATGLKLTRPAGTDVNLDGYTLTPSDGVAAANYTIADYKANKYKITKGSITFTVDNKSKVYGEEDPAFTYTVNNAGTTETEIRNNITIAREEGEEYGSYTIGLTLAEGYTNANYDIDASATGKFFIRKRPVTIAANAQTLYTGKTADDLVDNVTITNDLESEPISYKLSFDTAVELNSDDELTLDAAVPTKTYAQGIVVTLDADAENYASIIKNYAITLTSGALTVINSTSTLLLDSNADQMANITSAHGQTLNVSFSNRSMKAKEWYTVVLPFATTPAELVSALGAYVVVNRLNESSALNDIKFSLEMDEIPAGEPFLVKPATAINWSTVNFTGKVINKNLADVATAGATYKGVFNKTTIKNGKDLDGKDDADCKYRWLSDTDYEASVIANDWRNPNNKARDIKPMEAFLVLPVATSNSPRITVEDFDGQTTSIVTLSGANMNIINAQGWYTVDGMKLQNAPTEKGVYINNGKKVVIK